MKWTALAATAALVLTQAPIDVATARPKRVATETSPDLLQPSRARRSPAPSAGPALTAAAPTVEDVGDADSFGRNVVYLGLAQTLPVVLAPDCTGSDPTLERCIVLAAAPATTTFDEADLAQINLPAKATKSLVCFTFTPFMTFDFNNTTAGNLFGLFTASASIIIENSVLDDPTLIDPTTGLPFGGQLTVGLGTYREARTIEPGEIDSKRLSMSRDCIAGLVGKRALMETYGLSEALTKEFFKK